MTSVNGVTTSTITGVETFACMSDIAVAAASTSTFMFHDLRQGHYAIVDVCQSFILSIILHYYSADFIQTLRCDWAYQLEELDNFWSTFHFQRLCRIGDLLPFISHTITSQFSRLIEMTDANKVMNSHFRSDPADIRIRMPDHFSWKFWPWQRFALSVRTVLFLFAIVGEWWWCCDSTRYLEVCYSYPCTKSPSTENNLLWPKTYLLTPSPWENPSHSWLIGSAIFLPLPWTQISSVA